MTTHLVRIDGKRFVLMTGEEVNDVKRQVVEAVRSGGGFIRVRSTEGNAVDVLVTAQTSLMIEEVWVAEAESTVYFGAFVSADQWSADPASEYDTYGLDRLPA